MARTRRKARTQQTTLEQEEQDLLQQRGSTADVESWVTESTSSRVENFPTPNQATTPREGEKKVTLSERNVAYDTVFNYLKTNGLVATTDDLTRVGYLAFTQKDGTIPGLIQEVFILPSDVNKKFPQREFGVPLAGKYDLVTRTEVTSSMIPSLSQADIARLKLAMYQKGLYRSQEEAQQSLRMGFLPDDSFRIALGSIYRETSLENFRLLAQGQKNVLGVEDYIRLIPDISMGPTREISTTMLSPGDIDSRLREQYQSYVGRAPNEKEFEAFRNAVRSSSSRMPTVTTTIPGQPQLGGNAADTTRFRQEGFSGGDLSEMAIAEARRNPESAPYQKATKFFDAFLDSLPPVRGLEVQGTDLEGLLAEGGAS